MTKDTTRKLTGAALGLVGTLLIWQTGAAIALYFQSAGFSEFNQVLFDPKYSLRLLSAMAAFIAGLAALTERRGGAGLAGLASCLFGVQTLAMVYGRGHVHHWQSEAVYLIILTALFLALVTTNGLKFARERDVAQA
ncbi:MAG: hypothetical protein QNI84_13855 [Henriciella sp.]|nr:hypothetical protein [Henriciella sp.]